MSVDRFKRGQLRYHSGGCVRSGPDGLEWRHSSHCNAGACVEVAQSGEVIMVRRRGGQDGTVLMIQSARWQEFVAEARAGRFDVE